MELGHLALLGLLAHQVPLQHFLKECLGYQGLLDRQELRGLVDTKGCRESVASQGLTDNLA